MGKVWKHHSVLHGDVQWGKLWKHHSVLHGDVQWGKCGNITLCYTEMFNGESVETSLCATRGCAMGKVWKHHSVLH